MRDAMLKKILYGVACQSACMCVCVYDEHVMLFLIHTTCVFDKIAHITSIDAGRQSVSSLVEATFLPLPDSCSPLNSH